MFDRQGFFKFVKFPCLQEDDAGDKSVRLDQIELSGLPSDMILPFIG